MSVAYEPLDFHVIAQITPKGEIVFPVFNVPGKDLLKSLFSLGFLFHNTVCYDVHQPVGINNDTLLKGLEAVILYRKTLLSKNGFRK